MTNLDRRLERLEEKIQVFYRPTHIHLLRGDEEGNLVLFACNRNGNPDGCTEANEASPDRPEPARL